MEHSDTHPTRSKAADDELSAQFHPRRQLFLHSQFGDRQTQLLTQNIERLRSAFRYTQHRHPFTIEASVILPDHLHVIWTLPEDDADFALRWRLIKTEFSRALPSRESISQSRSSKGERGIWQRRYWEHRLRDEADFERHVNYIHFNPVKHGYVSRVNDWPFSSFHRMVRLGVLPADWAGDAREDGVEFGGR